MLSKILLWFAETFLPVRRIPDRCGTGPYLDRYYLLGHMKSRYALMLHRFRAGDTGALHDHPWSFWTLILTGGYYELTPGKPIYKVMWFPPLSFLRRPYTWRHKVLLAVEPKPGLKSPPETWTLVLRGPYRQKWGFYPNGAFVPHEAYMMEDC
jgi:hypothetical protein